MAMSKRVPSVNEIEIAIKAAKEARNVLKSSFITKTTAVSSSARDIKTQADIDAHKTICSILGKTGLPVISEESATYDANPATEACWVIDPLDGTVNYFRGSPLNCTSIGFWSEGKPIFGVIYDFLSNELYTGGEGFPAQRNGSQISVSKVANPSEAILATGFPNARDFDHAPLMRFVAQIQSFRKIRLLGSAALSLAWLADGRLDAYFEEAIYLWDVAAGLPIVTGAGGVIEFSNIDPKTMKLNVKATSTSNLIKSLKC